MRQIALVARWAQLDHCYVAQVRPIPATALRWLARNPAGRGAGEVL